VPGEPGKEELAQRRRRGAEKKRLRKAAATQRLSGNSDGCVDWGEPVVAVGLATAGDGEKLFLEFSRDGSGDAFANLDVIDGADRCNFDGGTGEEDFIRDVQHFPRDDRLFHGDTKVLRHLYDGVAGDAGKNAGG